MSRTIKFRGKRFDNGQWAYGNLIIDDSGNCEIVDYKNNQEIRYDVRGETIGQFTGLCDKSWKEIYEGDIVKTKEYGIDIPNGVFCSNVAGCDNFSVDYINGGFRLLNNQRGFLLCKGNHLEVIGNIYDNPELLKGGE